MINEHLIGTWWIYKNDRNNLFTYKGQYGPTDANNKSCCMGNNAEFTWMLLNNSKDSCIKIHSGSPRPRITSLEFNAVVDTSLLDLSPGSVAQIEIFPSGNWVMYD